MVRCPYNDVASFIYRYKPEKDNGEIKILELGSGDGNNVWYLKKEGFNIQGIEIDEDRIKSTYNRLKEDNLECNIANGSFTELPFADNEFDLVFDRAAVTCISLEDAKVVLNEVNRVLKKDGYFYFNPYNELDNNFFEGEFIKDGRIGKFNNSFKSYEGIHFYSLKEIIKLFSEDNWNMCELNILSKKELISSRKLELNMFEVVVKKI